MPRGADLTRLLVLGLSDAQIAAMHGCSRSGVSAARRNLGVVRWGYVYQVSECLEAALGRTPEPHESGHDLVRAYLRAALGDNEVPATRLTRARAMVRRLDECGQVLTLLPGGGWSAVPRTPSDENYLIRVPTSRRAALSVEQDQALRSRL